MVQELPSLFPNRSFRAGLPAGLIHSPSPHSHPPWRARTHRSASLQAFLPPFTPPVVTRLHHTVPAHCSPALVVPRVACTPTAALTPAGRALRALACHELPSCPGRSPVFTLALSARHTAANHPGRLSPSIRACRRRDAPLARRRLRHSPEGSSPLLKPNRVHFVAVCLVVSVASHPTSR